MKFAGPIRGALVAVTLLLVCSLAYGNTSSSSTTKTSAATSSKSKKSKKKASKKKSGQAKIDPKRASEIQEALIRENYLKGDASGVWDDASQKAMERFQADNGWQSKSVPDSRALIKLGLGPDHEHLLNPESAMTTQPPSPRPSAAPIHGPAAESADKNQPQ